MKIYVLLLSIVFLSCGKKSEKISSNEESAAIKKNKLELSKQTISTGETLKDTTVNEGLSLLEKEQGEKADSPAEDSTGVQKADKNKSGKDSPLKDPSSIPKTGKKNHYRYIPIMTKRSMGSSGSTSMCTAPIGKRPTSNKPKTVEDLLNQAAGPDSNPNSMISSSSTKASVLGTLNPRVLRSIIKKHKYSVTKCFKQEKQKTPDLTGVVRIKFSIRNGGVVSSCSIQQNLSSPNVGNCICKKIKGWRFPNPGTKPVSFSYSWKF